MGYLYRGIRQIIIGADHNMTFQLNILKEIRKNLLGLVEGLSTEQLNVIPQGFINNIAWNLGHVVAAQQSVCYQRAGLPLRVEQDFFERYKPGSKPEAYIGEAELAHIKELFLSTPDLLEQDYQGGLFKSKSYPTWTTRYGPTLSSIEEAVAFLPFHEGLHFGYIMAMKRAVRSGQETQGMRTVPNS